jgi:hypothetical protein
LAAVAVAVAVEALTRWAKAAARTIGWKDFIVIGEMVMLMVVERDLCDVDVKVACCCQRKKNFGERKSHCSRQKRLFRSEEMKRTGDTVGHD